MRSIASLLAVGCLCLFVASVHAAESTPRSARARPNVLFILTDDQRWNCMGIARNSVMQTPNIDRLGREGVYFPNAFCTTSLCSPSRASILSGLYAHTHGVSNNFTEYPDDMPTFPRALQQAGYTTAYIGKYHMGEENDDQRPGFDYFVTHKGQGKYFDNVFRTNGGERKLVKGYYTTVVTDMALDWLHNRDKSKPFLLMLGHKAPHSFYIPEDKYKHAFDNVPIDYPHTAYHLDTNPDWYRERLDTWHGIYGPLFEWRKNFPDRSAAAVVDFENMVHAYRGTILSVDDSVGKLYKELADEGVLDNTLIIFTTDNGLLEGEHGMVDKRTMAEPSIRVPLVVRYPGLTPPDKPKVIEQQVLHVDFAPTILDLCGAPALPKTHGRSWKKLVTAGDPDWRKAWYYECDYEKQFPYTPNVRGIRTDQWKYIRYPHGDGSPDRIPPELFDLVHDPEEAVNLAQDPKYADLCKRLSNQLDKLMDQVENSRKMPIYEGIGKELPDAKIR
ncbi:MAG: sulfatase-like hydrolase/transferase [Planctomycetes bacterium]|nr:sulfatase-like hydrolase/transferase [Planctomycetota bacterium]